MNAPLGSFRVACAAAAIMLAGGPSQAQINITSGFSVSTGWQPIILNNGSPNILATGGNPGGYADLVATLNSTTAGGSGFFSTTFFQLGSLNQVVIAADARWLSGPAPDLIPILVQSARVYQPSPAIGLGFPNWTSIGPTGYALSSFTSSSGIPLSLTSQTQVGFLARINSPTPATTSARVGIDNITLQVIPSPTAGTVLLLGLALGRRQRQPCQGSPALARRAAGFHGVSHRTRLAAWM